MNTVAKGNYHRNKTRTWLESEGYTVAIAETNYGVFLPKTGKIHYVKKDLWGGDLIAKNEEELIWVQVKANGGDVIAGARELLTSGPWPGVTLWVVHWPLRRRLTQGPEITVVTPECPELGPDPLSSASGKTG